jgi:two-component system, OmpR family, response regulator
MPRILVVDDDLHQLALYRHVLETAGHQVAFACTPLQTLKHMAGASADLVILDLRLLNSHAEPDARLGLALIRELRDSGCTAPLMVLSGWPEDLDGQPEEKLVTRVLPKPVSPPDLVNAVGALLN